MNPDFTPDTICAQASAQGPGAISVIRISGPQSITTLDTVFKSVSGFKLSNASSHEMFYGAIVQPAGGETIDEVMAAIFKAPHSYTGEDSAEIYCHGSDYIVSEIIKLLLAQGIRMAQPGEFTKRAFLNGKLDLAQAEAVADLIASETKAAHDVALTQMKGGFSDELKSMRTELVEIVSLMELELDFSEEDVEFADRIRLRQLLQKAQNHISRLISSFTLGNVIKNGVPVAIVGATNTGKSTLLNALLGEERAIVSEIAGTTRDTIEDTINIDGIIFRFIDTAGIRNTSETIEMIGIERTYAKMRQASIIILMLDAERPNDFAQNIDNLAVHLQNAATAPSTPSATGASSSASTSDRQIIILLNKSDLVPASTCSDYLALIEQLAFSATASTPSPLPKPQILPISAKKKIGLDELTSLLSNSRKSLKTAHNGTMVTNLRHYEALTEAQTALFRVREGLTTQIPTDLIAQDIREALYYIGTITGEVTTDEVLGTIFQKFCIGK